MYNIGGSPFKMHSSPSGALMLHNTSVKKGMPMVCYGGPKVRNCVFRNNLFIGTPANYAFESTATMIDCDFDYDGFGGGPWKKLLKWNGARYGTLKDVKQGGEAYGHGVLIEAATAFVSHLAAPVDEKKQFDGREIDLRLAEGCAAVDAGQVLVASTTSSPARHPIWVRMSAGRTSPITGRVEASVISATVANAPKSVRTPRPCADSPGTPRPAEPGPRRIDMTSAQCKRRPSYPRRSHHGQPVNASLVPTSGPICAPA